MVKNIIGITGLALVLLAPLCYARGAGILTILPAFLGWTILKILAYQMEGGKMSKTILALLALAAMAASPVLALADLLYVGAGVGIAGLALLTYVFVTMGEKKNVN